MSGQRRSWPIARQVVTSRAPRIRRIRIQDNRAHGLLRPSLVDTARPRPRLRRLTPRFRVGVEVAAWAVVVTPVVAVGAAAAEEEAVEATNEVCLIRSTPE